jgi:hypothetical protein
MNPGCGTFLTVSRDTATACPLGGFVVATAGGNQGESRGKLVEREPLFQAVRGTEGTQRGNGALAPQTSALTRLRHADAKQAYAGFELPQRGRPSYWGRLPWS